jgi:DNA-binding transcriptional ArsR family regulator
MADTLLEKEVKTLRIVSVDQKSAQALGDSVRMRMLEILNHKPMSAEELAKALGNIGYKKAVTTVRHHLEALKNAGLIDTTKMVEVRGAVLKYYAPRVKAIDFAVPAGFDANHARLIQETSAKIQKILKSVQGDKKLADSFGRSGEACTLCKVNHSHEHAVIEIVNQALTKALQNDAGSEEKEKPPMKKS